MDIVSHDVKKVNDRINFDDVKATHIPVRRWLNKFRVDSSRLLGNFFDLLTIVIDNPGRLGIPLLSNAFLRFLRNFGKFSRSEAFPPLSSAAGYSLEPLSVTFSRLLFKFSQDLPVEVNTVKSISHHEGD